jgi:molecular chaperone DnaK (HSP70)
LTTVAIDFGTSNTLVCLADPVTHHPRTLKLDRICRRFPSEPDPVEVVPTLVFIEGPARVILGEEVRSQRLGFAQPERLFQGFKRDLVAEYVPPARILDGEAYAPERVAELFLQRLKRSLTEAQIQPTQVILTVPVGSFESYLSWIRKMAAKLDFPNVQVVDESTAAALGYAVTHPGSLVLVLDFGGGTLDLSLVRTQPITTGKTSLRAEVIAKSDAYVGGIDIDAWIVEHYLEKIGSSRNAVGKVGWQNLLELAERLKIQLSSQNKATESWFDDESFMTHELTLTQADLEEILESQHLFEQIRQALDETLLMAQGKGVTKPQIEQVLLVGGSCQIPAIQQLVNSYFGRKRVRCHKPFEAVAHGALILGQQIEVEDYLRHSYAIRLWDPYAKSYSYFPLFERGLPYPCQREEPLILQVSSDGQTEIRLDIGEVAETAQSEVVYDAQGRMSSRKLTRQSDFRALSGRGDPVCLARLDPVGKAGVDRIRITFRVDEQRVLRATVEDLQTLQILVQNTAVAKLQ